MKRPAVQAGDIVKIHRKIKEGAKERVQAFEGIVIAVKGKQSSSPMITVRRISLGIGVEITIPVYSPTIAKIEILKQAKVRRSKLCYLRRKALKISKLKTKELDQFVEEEPAHNVIPPSGIAGGKEEAPEAAQEEKPKESK